MNRATIRDSEFHYAYTMTASDLNRYGIMHGGRLLTLCDEVGYVAARKHAAGDCLTRAVHQAQFHHAIEEGTQLTFRARVGLTGYSSLWVLIEAISTRDGRCMMDAVFVYAAIDEHRHVRAVAGLRAETDAEQQLQARLRRMREQV